MTRGRKTGVLLVGLAALGAASVRADEPLRERIDRAIEARAEGRVAPPADDAEFVRRIWIDLVGRIPRRPRLAPFSTTPIRPAASG